LAKRGLEQGPKLMGEAASQATIIVAPRLQALEASLNKLASSVAEAKQQRPTSPNLSRSPSPKLPLAAKHRSKPDPSMTAVYAEALKGVRKDLAKKADLSKMCTLMDQKADITEVNQLIGAIHAELDVLPAPEEWAFIQTSLQSSLPFLLTQALWLWKHGGTKETVVQWDTERYNFRSQSFALTRNNCVIEVRDEGLYQLTFGFYGRVKALVEVWLNGEVMVSSDRIQMNAAAQKFENAHSNGYVVGRLRRNDFPGLRGFASVCQIMGGVEGSGGV